MRLYTFNNLYLSSIQKGIQSAHVVHELFSRYIGPNTADPAAGDQEDQLVDWAENYKTMILLDGGYASSIQLLFEFFEDDNNPFPFMKFHEEVDSLNGALTSLGIILPEYIYETAATVRLLPNGDADLVVGELVHYGQGHTTTLTAWEIQLISKLKTYRLAS